MIKEVSKKLGFLFFCIIQLFILGFAFYILTSTLNIFSWYEPLTMGAFFMLFFLTIIQTFITIIINIMYKKDGLFKDNCRIANFNLVTLIFGIMLVIILGDFNNIITIFIIITECFMAAFLVHSLINGVNRLLI